MPLYAPPTTPSPKRLLYGRQLGHVYFSDSGNSEIQEISPSGTAPFPATAVGTSADKTLTLSNIGNLPLTIPSKNSFTPAGNTTDFALTRGTGLAGATLAALSSTCSLQISFTPTAAGLRSVTISSVNDALNAPQSFTITGTGTAGAPTLAWAHLDLTATFTLTFSALGSSTVNDPAIQFAGGGRTFSVMVPANSTVVPTVQFQAGTDAETITVAATLAADGLVVTPDTLVPLVITVPPCAPILTATTITRTGDQLTVAVHGYSNTRELSQTSLHFVAPHGAFLDTADVDAKVPAATLFGGWYAKTASQAYGSSSTYSLLFNTSDAATNVGAVTVTLTNLLVPPRRRPASSLPELTRH